ncbi:hypothetical protein FRUB_03692 [Fimbriiglobus ruber]|uniref:Uncharacterized protein n=1 Tax=Fimbriiglobus ruber TaxID=1908690 RepID=A0A225DPP7_9BACT|nr:hypothetical protein FRUB_03692 [Fimbriiglobus ruber]
MHGGLTRPVSTGYEIRCRGTRASPSGRPDWRVNRVSILRKRSVGRCDK